MSSQLTFVIAGLGSRGMGAYSSYIWAHPDEMRINAVADILPEKLRKAALEYELSPGQCFGSVEELFTKDKLADVAVIATQDRQHFAHAMSALEKGYHLLLEKPISPMLSECVRLRDEAARRKLTITVCHVLRYTPFFRELKKLIDDGEVGKVLSVNLIENVGYWHQAHSFVRGKWSNDALTSPMILAKSCHDMDILHFLLGKRCLRLSSFGELGWFKKDNAPSGAAPYCSDAGACRTDCPYDAQKIYIDQFKDAFAAGAVGWPVNVVEENPTIESLKETLKTSQFGRCVYHCGNNVVDHQVVAMLFDGGITGTFTMTGFTHSMSRQVKVMGSMGEIEGDMSDALYLKRFGKKPKKIDLDANAVKSGHGGGDEMLMKHLKDSVNGTNNINFSGIDQSVHSHVMALAAEHSRINNGEIVDIEAFEKCC